VIETKLKIGKRPEWRDKTDWIVSRVDIFFGAYDYRIFGEVFTTRGIEFDEAFDKYLTWRILHAY